jgi:hypothetical protein
MRGNVGPSLEGLVASEGDSEKVDWEAALRAALAQLPQDYEERAKELMGMSHIFRAQLAASMEPSINTQIQSLPYETLDQKRSTAYWVNHELRQFGLSIRCPNTGRPAILVVDFPEGKPSASRFRLETRDENGKKMRKATSNTPFQLQLMEDVPRIEGTARWAERIQHASPKPNEK